MRPSCIATAFLTVGSLCLGIAAAAQQQSVDDLNEARAKMVQAEKDHGPQSKELADALRTFVIAAIDSDIRPLTEEFRQAAQRDIDVNAAAYGEGSAQHVDAIELASSMYSGPRSFDLARQAAELTRRLNPPEPHVLSRAVVWLGTLCCVWETTPAR